MVKTMLLDEMLRRDCGACGSVASVRWPSPVDGTRRAVLKMVISSHLSDKPMEIFLNFRIL
jgi:hypothetical protein